VPPVEQLLERVAPRGDYGPDLQQLLPKLAHRNRPFLPRLAVSSDDSLTGSRAWSRRALPRLIPQRRMPQSLAAQRCQGTTALTVEPAGGDTPGVFRSYVIW
jgi:hypothetical protein